MTRSQLDAFIDSKLTAADGTKVTTAEHREVEKALADYAEYCVNQKVKTGTSFDAGAESISISIDGNIVQSDARYIYTIVNNIVTLTVYADFVNSTGGSVATFSIHLPSFFQANPGQESIMISGVLLTFDPTIKYITMYNEGYYEDGALQLTTSEPLSSGNTYTGTLTITGILQ